MVDFAGFSMPVQYTSIIEEHRAVRETAGLFDVSHMGQIHLTGPEAMATGDRLLSRPVSTQPPGRGRYALLCNESGGVVDDVTVYRTGQDSLFLCVNAANIEKDYRWIVRHAREGVTVRNSSDETALLAIQGPASAEILANAAGPSVASLRRYAFESTQISGAKALVSRTGYTGSDGFEVYLDAGEAQEVFDALRTAGAAMGLAAQRPQRVRAEALQLLLAEDDRAAAALQTQQGEAEGGLA